MVGLVFEGGGVKGSYQVGAYYAFKKCHIKIDGIVGTSIGSINAAFIAAKKEKELLKLWKSIDTGNLMGFSKEYVDAVNNNESFLKKAYYSLKDVKKIINNKGISTENIKKILISSLNEDDIRKSNIDFGLNTVRVKDLKPLYIFKDDIPKGKMIDYILASCYLPVFKMEKIVDDNYYIDGGFYDNSPSNMLEKKGYKTIYIIGLKGIGITHKKINKANIIRIDPSRNLGSTLNVKKSEIHNNIKLGYFDTIKVLKNLDGYKYIFKNKNTKFYERLVRNVDKKILVKIQNYFLTVDSKELVLRSLEYILKCEKENYTHIYSPFWYIIWVKNHMKDDIFYKFIKKLKLF